MARISIPEVEHVAELSRLELSEEERKMFTEQLSAILEYFAKLRELDTEGVEPTSHVVPVSNVIREDKPREPMSREEALSNAPEAARGCFKVPRVVE